MGFHDSRGVYHAFYKTIPLPLSAFRVGTTGDVGAVAVAAGLLGSDSAPTLTGASTGISQIVTWAASGVAQILAHVPLPDDFEPRNGCIVELFGASGTTNAFSFTVASSWDGGATVSDTATGQASATAHASEATIDGSDIPAGARSVSLAITPAAHTTNAFILSSARIKYAPRVA
jgi:hypothetical protein